MISISVTQQSAEYCQEVLAIVKGGIKMLIIGGVVGAVVVGVDAVM